MTRPDVFRILQSHYTEIRDCFFSRDTIVYSLHVLMTNSVERNLQQNRLNSVCVVCLQEDLEIGFTEDGLTLFRSDPSIIFPYASMSKPQLQSTSDLLCFLEDHNIMHASPINSSCAFLYHTQNNLNVNVHANHVLFGIMVIIYLNSQKRVVNYQHLCNVMLDQIINTVVIPRQCVTDAIQEMHKYIEQKSEKGPSDAQGEHNLIGGV